MPVSKRPGAVTAIAVLHFVFGGLDIASALCIGVGSILFASMMSSMPPPPPGQPDIKEMFRVIDRNSPEAKWYLIGALVEALLAGILMITAGVGLLKMRYWGRNLTMIYAVMSILWTLCSTVYLVGMFNPGMQKAMKELEKQEEEQQKKRPPGSPAPPPAFGGMSQGNPTANAISTIIQQAIYLAYPAAVLIIMMLKSVRRAFAVANGDAPPPEEPRDELDWDRPVQDRDDLDEPPRESDVTSFRPK
jgi:hypothetical protein